MPSASKQPAAKSFKFDPHALANEELLYVYRGRTNALLVAGLSGAVMALVLAWGLKSSLALAWFPGMLLAYGWHWAVGRTDKATGSIATPLSDIKLHIAAAGLAGAGWGSAALALPWLNPSAQATIIVLLVIAVITSLPRLVVFLPVFYAYTAGVLVPLILVLPFLATDTLVLGSIVLLVTGLTLALSAREIRELLIQILLKQINFEQVSWEDRLTGLGNRRHFDDKLDGGWRQAARQSVPMSLIILDVDMFKKYNDKYGHPAGDECLRQVATALASCVKRAGDSVARYGGEEFGVVMVHMPMADAKNMGERMRLAVMNLALEHELSPYGVVTISIGGATIIPSTNATPQELIKQADEALYRAKESGRNKVEWNMLA
jgi:diguanylate cyclase (GGDEF)-like protein